MRYRDFRDRVCFLRFLTLMFLGQNKTKSSTSRDILSRFSIVTRLINFSQFLRAHIYLLLSH